jgi:bisphosphoglycerate-independent phosphoglycerate mutase (AlkP superfamily)
MTLGVGTQTKDPLETLHRFYEQNVTDEFMEPISVLTPDGAHRGRVEDGDALIFFNFRADRMRQIVTAFKDADFSTASRAHASGRAPDDDESVSRTIRLPVLYPPAARSTTTSAKSSRTRASRSSASRRPKSTRTSPSSSTAAPTRTSKARIACSCRRRRSRRTI